MNTPNQESVNNIFAIISNPKSLKKETIINSSYRDWVFAINNVKSSLKAEIGRGIDPNLKLEIQVQQRNQQEATVRANYQAQMAGLKEGFAQQKSSLVSIIKARKFPLYHQTQQADVIGRVVPNYSARQLGAIEIQTAAQMPLKHITVQLLTNYQAAGRTDLVSALVERVALNRGELQGRTWDEVKDFTETYYQKLGITEERNALKKLIALEETVISHTANSIDYDSSALVLSQSNYESKLKTDDYLEL